jgi:hypothetical protein
MTSARTPSVSCSASPLKRTGAAGTIAATVAAATVRESVTVAFCAEMREKRAEVAAATQVRLFIILRRLISPMPRKRKEQGEAYQSRKDIRSLFENKLEEGREMRSRQSVYLQNVAVKQRFYITVQS